MWMYQTKRNKFCSRLAIPVWLVLMAVAMATVTRLCKKVAVGHLHYFWQPLAPWKLVSHIFSNAFSAFLLAGILYNTAYAIQFKQMHITMLFTQCIAECSYAPDHALVSLLWLDLLYNLLYYKKNHNKSNSAEFEHVLPPTWGWSPRTHWFSYLIDKDKHLGLSLGLGHLRFCFISD